MPHNPENSEEHTCICETVGQSTIAEAAFHAVFDIGRIIQNGGMLSSECL